MILAHRAMKTCDGGADCPADCRFRAMRADPKWAAYLDPGSPSLPRLRKSADAEPCRHLGEPTGETVECPSCSGGAVRLKTFACAVHGTCTAARRVVGVACCAGCPDRQTAADAATSEPEALYVEIVPDQSGVGDHAIVLLTLDGVRRANPGRRVVLVAAEHAATWMRLWWPDTIVGRVPNGAERLQPLPAQRPAGRRAEARWARAARMAGNVKLAVPPLWAPLPPEEIEAVRHFAGAVVLAPETMQDDRIWPLPCWLELERLLIAAGRRCVVLGQVATNLLRFRSTPVIGQHPARVAALLQLAGAVVANDGGPAHLAGLMQTPAVALCGIVGGQRVFGGYQSVRWLDGPLPCNGCEWHDPERALYGCQRCASLDQIAPAAVAQAVSQIIRPAPAPPAPVGPVAVVTAWDAAYEPLARVTWPALVRYCDRRGYTPVRGAIDKSRHPMWSKVPAMLGALADHEAVLWVDADALITGDADVWELLGADADVTCSHDHNGFLSGCLALRSVDWVKAALRAAWEAYPRYEGHVWADQLAIAEQIAEHPDRVRVLPQKALHPYPQHWQPGDFIVHPAAMSIGDRLAAFRVALKG